MGKRKQNALNKKEVGKEFSEELFVSVWEGLNKLNTEKLRFALYWILCNEKVLELFVRKVLKHESLRFSKTLFLNGYLSCKDHSIQISHPEMFNEIDNILSHHVRRLKLPRPLRKIITIFSDFNIKKLISFQRERERSCKSGNTYARTDIDMKRISSSKLKALTGVILGDWEYTGTNFVTDDEFILLKFPSDLIVMEEKKGFTYYFDKSGTKPYVIAMVSRDNILSPDPMIFVRRLLEQLHAAHHVIQRGRGRKSWESEMTGFGPFDHRYNKNRDCVSFYTHQQKIRTLFSDDSFDSASFEDMIDRYSHRDIIDIILGLYMWLCPQMVQSLLNYSHPYLGSKDYEMNMFEKALNCKGPSAYQLYISKDYCVETHADHDSAEFTLCYASHPDSKISPVNFVIPEYGMLLPIRDGNLFAFRSDIVHGTGYRIPSSKAVYVGAVTVNKKLDRLLQRKH